MKEFELAYTVGTGLERVQSTRKLMSVFNGHPVRTGHELATAMRQDWKAATDLLKNWPNTELMGWLKTRPDGDLLVRALGMEKSGGARLIRRQAEYDPDGPLEFQGIALDEESLYRRIHEAIEWNPDAEDASNDAYEWLAVVRDQRILVRVAAVIEGPDTASVLRADNLLHEWEEQSEKFLDEAMNAWARVDQGAASRLTVSLGVES